MFSTQNSQCYRRCPGMDNCQSRQELLEFILHYLDDFLLGDSPGSDSCGRALDPALYLCNEVGFPVMAEKVVGPSTVIDFLEFLIDTMAMENKIA